MKKYLLPALFFTVTFFSCSKTYEDRLIGSWKLVSSYRQRTFDRDHFTTGYETGIFTFNENGTAIYTSATDTLWGNWDADRYSTSDGTYKELKIELLNFLRNKYLFWEFDDFNFRDNWKEIRAREYSLSTDRVYDFKRQ